MQEQHKDLDQVGTQELMDQLDDAYNESLGYEPKEQPEKATNEPELHESEEPEAVPDEVEETEPEVTIDYDLEIPMPDGRDAMSIGGLKDRVTELERTEQQYIDRENDIMRQQDELKDAIQLAGGEVPPELRQQMARKQEAHLAKEHEAMLAAIPEMAEKAGFDKVRKSVADVFEQYGAADVVGQVTDHRLIKMAYDLARLQNKEATAQETVKQLHSKATSKGRKVRKDSRSALDKQVASAMKSSNSDDKMQAIDDLLKLG